MRPAHCSFLSIILKRNGAPYSLVLRFLCSHSYTECVVECKEDLNASRAQLVLERTILKNEGRLPYSIVAW